MSMLPQPPSDAPEPPMSDIELPPFRWRMWLWIGVAILAIAFLSVMPPNLHWHRFKESRIRELIRTIDNMRQVGFGLMEFETNYGSFPNEKTIAKVRANCPTKTIPFGQATANDYFRQLLASEDVTSEAIFRGYPDRRPGDDFEGANALEKGECSFAYINGLTTEHPPETPLVVYPLVKGKLIFDYKLCKQWRGKAAILRVDNSVTTLPVDKHGHVYLNGKDLFDPSQPFWGGKAPDVKWPE